MKAVFAVSEDTAQKIHAAIAAVAEQKDLYTVQTVSSDTATHRTSGGYIYKIDLERSILTFEGSRTSLQNGCHVGAIRRAHGVDWCFQDRTKLGWDEYPIELVSVSSSLPQLCPFASDPLASDAAIAAWFTDPEYRAHVLVKMGGCKQPSGDVFYRGKLYACS